MGIGNDTHLCYASSALLLCQPPLELVYTSLWNDDALGRFECEVYGQAAAKPYRDILNRLARDDKLAVGAEEIITWQLALQCFERKVHLIPLAVVAVGGNSLLEGVQEGDIVVVQRDNLITEVDKEYLLLGMLSLCHRVVHARGVLLAVCRGESLPLLDGTGDIRLVDRFEQVVDTVDLECLDSVLIVGGGEDYRNVDTHGVEYAERSSVGKVYIHKYQVELLFRAEEIDTVNNGINRCDNLHIGANLTQYGR